MAGRAPPGGGGDTSEVPLVGAIPGELDLEAEMLELQRGVDALVPPGGDTRVLVFTGARAGEGTSTIARAFARLLADRTKGSTLILDANQNHPDQHRAFGLSNEVGWDDFGPSDELERAIYRTSYPRLWVSPMSWDDTPAANLLEGAMLERMLHRLRHWFDTVIVDSGPLATCPAGLALARQANGVILVVEADATRWPVAQAAQNAIVRAGARPLGVVLNKRRYHIPGPIYRLL
jgi:Mrp family chromosome partitioning ATPase